MVSRLEYLDCNPQQPLSLSLSLSHTHYAPRPKSYMDLYLHDMSIARFCPQLLADPLFKIPAFFTRDLLQQIDIKQNAYWPSLFVGGASTSSGLHSDWGSSAAWMMVLQGRKHWVIAKPSSRAALFECVPTLENPTEDRFDGDLMKDTSSSSENGNDGASCGDLPTSLLEPGEVFEDVLEAGEVLFIPADCPHQVRNLDTVRTVRINAMHCRLTGCRLMEPCVCLFCE